MASADEELVKQLREVFDLCDELKCGIISVNQLRDIVRKHFGGSEEEIAQLIECLDPNQHGVVTFADFCSGVVSTMQNKGTSFEETTLRYQKPNVLVSSPHLQVDGTARDDSSPPPPGDTDSAIATGSDVSRESLADKQDSGSDDCDENFTCMGHLTRPENSSGSFRSTSSHGSCTGGASRRRRSRILNRSSCKRLSTSALANQLHRSGSRRNSQSSDEMYPLDVPMSIEDDVIDLNQKVQELQSQVATLTDHQVNTDQRYNRVKQENAALQNKIHSLEEQLRELEIRSEDRLETEQQKFKEIMARCERESKLELEQYATKLFQLQKEYMEMSEESFRLKTQIERLKQEKQDLQNQLYECTTELLNLRDEHHRLQESTRREREEFQTERANSNKLLDELSKELEKHSESAGETRLRSPSLLELPAQYRELQQELKKIKDENKLILETNEELNAQLLANSLQEGRTLVSQNSAISLADEFETLTKDDDISDFLSMVTDCFTLKIVSTSLILLYL
ncbi:rab11 family-interacting protein 4A isoform X2 [Parasteatoda tepidariorum]|uniref:rab11 family-interacting protein 4A isoform X2 n=1 Tax=Parasteatoda tepidariorum TaxID=114398 RepID=UPI0039BC87D6